MRDRVKRFFYRSLFHRYRSLLWVFFHMYRSHLTHDSCLWNAGLHSGIWEIESEGLLYRSLFIDAGLFCGSFSTYIGLFCKALTRVRRTLVQVSFHRYRSLFIDTGLFCGYFSIYIDHISHTIAAYYILGGTEIFKIESKGLFHGFFLDRYRSLLWVFFHIHRSHLTHNSCLLYTGRHGDIQNRVKRSLSWFFVWIDISLLCGYFSIYIDHISHTIAAYYIPGGTEIFKIESKGLFHGFLFG